MQRSHHGASVVFSKILRLTLVYKIALPVLHQLNLFKAFSSSTYSLNFSNASSLRTYSSLTRQCTEGGKSVMGIKRIQAHMEKSGFPLPVSGSKLIDACLKRGNIAYARKLFEEMPERHIVTWNSMIASYISQKRSKEAIELYVRMVMEGVSPDEYTLSSVFKAFCDLGLEYEGRRAHGLSVILGLEVSNAFVGSALVDMYAKFGKMRDARLVSDRVVEKDVVLFTALIVGYLQHDEDSEALQVFRSMISEGIRANEYTFAGILIACGNLENLGNGKLIHGLITKSGFESAVASQTSLLTMYSRCGLIDYSLKIFKCLENPNIVSWTSLISGLVQNGREEIALSKFRKMMRDSVNPNSFTLSSVIRACSSLAMLEEGRQMQALVTKFGLDGDKYAGAALIDLYGKCGSPEPARLLFDSLIEVDLISINSMMYGYAQNGFGHETLKLFDKMKDMGLRPNDVTILSVLLACNNSGLVEEGCQFFTSINKNKNAVLTKDHYACMVDLFGRAGRLKEAEILIKQAGNPDVVLWRTLLSACRIHGDVEVAERIKDRVLELAPEDEGTHILLCNLYASTGKWNRFIEIKSRMRGMKLKKNPAVSWVHVDKEVHTFMAGDWSHPRRREIRETLEDLIEKTKTMGYAPDTNCVLLDMDKRQKEISLYYHSEKIAIAFALWRTGITIYVTADSFL